MLSVHVQIAKAFESLVAESVLRTAAQATLATEARETAELTVVVSDDQTIRDLNKQYRGIDAATDVLSFGGETPDFVQGPEHGPYLGDVIISFPRAEAQATAAGHPVDAELSLLVVHGILHLMGYDHLNADDKAAMWRRQAETLDVLGASLPDFDDLTNQ